MIELYPSPWNLTGKGYIMIYRFNSNFVNKFGNVPGFLEGKFSGGFGSVMLVDYSSTNAGPYSELLFIPGKFKHENKKIDTISKIYVSTMESVVNGKNNWGIPKEQADFKFEMIDVKREHIVISTKKDVVADFIIKSYSVSFPVNTKLIPFPLVQLHEDKYFYTNFSGAGKGRFAKLESVSINSEYFPDISLCKPIAVIKVEPFKIYFPESRIKNLKNEKN